MHLDIVTPEKNIFSGDITSLTVPTTSGYITILPHHVNLLTQVSPGEVDITFENKKQYLGITGGFLEMNNDKITIVADYAVRSEDIAVEKAIAAQKRAEEILRKKEEGISEQDLVIAQSDIRRAAMELHVANRRKHRHNTV